MPTTPTTPTTPTMPRSLRCAVRPAARTHDLVVVTGHLPSPDEGRRGDPASATWPGGGLDVALRTLLGRRAGLWVSASRGGDRSRGAARQGDGRDDQATARTDVDTLNVPLSSTEIAGYDAGMCNATLWRLFHGAVTQPLFRRAWWNTYVAVNRRFAEAARRGAAPGATVWVQGFRLQLVPAMLRRARPDLTIGFSSRLPFPPFELFAQLPWRRQLLQGLSGADLIGLPRASDVANLLSCAHRCGTGAMAVAPRQDDLGRFVARRGDARHLPQVLAFPSSVNARTLDHAARDRRAMARSQQLRAALAGSRKVLLGVDLLDDTRGILHRLDALSALFARGELDTSDTVYVQIAIPSHHNTGSGLREQVEAAVARLNGTYAGIGRPVVHYLHQDVSSRDLIPLYLASDALLTTPLSEGANLAAQEYVASRHDGQGVVVLSEFSGTVADLPGALIVNPHDPDAFQDAIARAATLPPDEASRRMHAMRRRLFSRDAERTVGDFLDSLSAAHAAHHVEGARAARRTTDGVRAG